MANWCFNTVNFTGEQNQLHELETLFNELAYRERETTCGQLPDFVIDNDRGWFFEIDWNDNSLTYQTKWTPNTNRLIEIADHFGVGFIHNYEEMGMCIYGEAIYLHGRLTEIDLDDSDFEQYQYDDETDRYTFEGQKYEGDWEILETLLDRKKAAIHTATQPKR